MGTIPQWRIVSAPVPIIEVDEAVDVTDLELDTKGRHIFPRLR